MCRILIIFGWHAQKMNQATLAIRMRENADYNNAGGGHFLRSVGGPETDWQKLFENVSSCVTH